MAQTIDQIEDHIDRTREQLGSDFRELEDKVSAATDWRAHYERTPALFLGAAAVGGIVLAAMLSGRRTRRAPAMEFREAGEFREARPLVPERVRTQTNDFVNNFASALIGIGAAKLTEYIDSVVPGFDEQYRTAKQDAH